MKHQFERLVCVAGLISIWSLSAADSRDIARISGSEEAPLEFEAGSLRMMDRQVGWAKMARTASVSGELVFNRPALLRTIDGGKSWRRVLVCNTNDLMAEYVRDAQTAWVAVVKDYEEFSNTVAVLRTHNGGQSWVNSEVPQPHAIEFAFLDFPNPKTGWLMLIPDHGMNSSPGCLYRSDSGGASWQLVNSVEQKDGDPEDQIEQQASRSRPLPRLPYGGQVLFRNAKTGWLWGAATTTTPRFVSVTEDGGRTWRVLGFPPPRLGVEGGITPLEPPRFFPRAGNDGILCAQFSSTDDGAANPHALVYRTGNGGRTWRCAPPLKTFGIFDFLSAKQGWFWSAAQDGPGPLYRTDDCALSWKPVGSHKRNPIVGPRRIVQLNFVDREFGWALVEDNSGRSQLLRTSDGGVNWASVQPVLKR